MLFCYGNQHERAMSRDSGEHSTWVHIWWLQNFRVFGGCEHLVGGRKGGSSKPGSKTELGPMASLTTRSAHFIASRTWVLCLRV